MHDTLALHTYNSLKDVVAVPTQEAFANYPSEFVKVPQCSLHLSSAS